MEQSLCMWRNLHKVHLSGFFLKIRVNEICVKRIRVNQGVGVYECTGHPNYDRKQGFLPFTLVLGTLIDKSWLIYLALYIGEERNSKEEKEKKQKMGCFLYLINWLTQKEKKEIHFKPWGDFSFSAVIHISLIMKK